MPFPRRAAVVTVVIGAVVTLSLTGIREPVIARAAIIVGICLILWLSEAVPPYVPTLLLWGLTPLLLEGYGEQFTLSSVLTWSADPVLVLFLGGFTLSVAATRYGLDAAVARLAVRLSGGRRVALLGVTAVVTAFLSMWMSNIAAAAMMLAALRPLTAGMPRDDSFRRALLLAIAMGANFGGIATPIGTGSNAIAIAAVSDHHPITFLGWMAFALPLMLGMLAASIVLLVLRFRVRGIAALPDLERKPTPRGGAAVIVLFLLTVTAWLTEPLHGASSATVALLATAALFGSGLLRRADLDHIDWSTLALIAGGIGLGNLLQQSGLVTWAAAAVPWSDASPLARIALLCFASALLSALMSNTATATLLIPLAGSLDPAPSTAILIALAASMGIPFVVSTPPNAMVYGEGGIKNTDILLPGLLLMVLGCLVISVTGPFFLRLMGVP